MRIRGKYLLCVAQSLRDCFADVNCVMSKYHFTSVLPGSVADETIVRGILPGSASPVTIRLAAHGSATAFVGLADGSCDIGMASRNAVSPTKYLHMGSNDGCEDRPSGRTVSMVLRRIPRTADL